jgi:type II secretory pathway pseudopilin PulG
LVVIAVIGLLVGLLIPAVQAARESARTANCASNMRAIRHQLTPAIAASQRARQTLSTQDASGGNENVLFRICQIT